MTTQANTPHATTTPAQARLQCDDCGIMHLGEFTYVNAYGQVCYSVEADCPYHDTLTLEAAV